MSLYSLTELHAAIAICMRLPRAVAEPIVIDFDSALNATGTGNGEPADGLGHIVSPDGVKSACVRCLNIPRFVRSGGLLSFRVVASTAMTLQTMRVAAQCLLELIEVDVVYFDSGGVDSESSAWLRASALIANFTALPDAGGVVVNVAVPSREPGGRQSGQCYVGVTRIAVCGATLDGEWPITVQVIDGLSKPQCLGVISSTNFSAPCILPDGELALPSTMRNATILRVYNPEGSIELEAQSLPGLSSQLRTVTFDQSNSLLLVADSPPDQSHVAAYVYPAVDRAGSWLTNQWRSEVLSGCFGLAIVPSQHVLLASSFFRNLLVVLRLATGETLATHSLRGVSYMVTDTSSAYGTVYMSCESPASSSSHCVRTCEYNRHGDGALSIGPPLDCLVDQSLKSPCPLAIIPPDHGRIRSHLVVGCKGREVLHVVSLPEHRLIHTHRLEGFAVVGLAGDPLDGSVIVVCDGKRDPGGGAHVLPWPLPGMPELE